MVWQHSASGNKLATQKNSTAHPAEIKKRTKMVAAAELESATSAV